MAGKEKDASKAGQASAPSRVARAADRPRIKTEINASLEAILNTDDEPTKLTAVRTEGNVLPRRILFRYSRAAVKKIRQTRRAVFEAGFPEDQREFVLDEIDKAFEVFRTKPSQSHEGFTEVISISNKLLDSLKRLTPGMQRLLDPAAHRSVRWTALTEIIKRAKQWEAVMGFPSRPGRPRNRELEGLLITLVVMWKSAFPNKREITRHASESDYGGELYSGPLLDFIQKLLDVEGISYTSREALGTRLDRFIKRNRIPRPRKRSRAKPQGLKPARKGPK